MSRKYCVVEVDFVQSNTHMVSRIAGPYDLKSAMETAEYFANEAMETNYNPDDGFEVKEIDALDQQEIAGDSAGIFGVVLNDDPQVYYVVKELFTPPR